MPALGRYSAKASATRTRRGAACGFCSGADAGPGVSARSTSFEGAAVADAAPSAELRAMSWGTAAFSVVDAAPATTSPIATAAAPSAQLQGDWRTSALSGSRKRRAPPKSGAQGGPPMGGGRTQRRGSQDRRTRSPAFGERWETIGHGRHVRQVTAKASPSLDVAITPLHLGRAVSHTPREGVGSTVLPRNPMITKSCGADHPPSPPAGELAGSGHDLVSTEHGTARRRSPVWRPGAPLPGLPPRWTGAGSYPSARRGPSDRCRNSTWSSSRFSAVVSSEAMCVMPDSGSTVWARPAASSREDSR